MKIIKIYLLLAISVFLLGSCLDIQDSYDYKPSNIDNNINMGTWEFINSRQDVFSILKEAIEKVGLQETYSQTSSIYTYILLKNTAFTKSTGIFVNLGITSIDDINTAEKMLQLKNILLYHIIRGNYNGLGTLNFDPINVITLWDSQDAIMTIKLDDASSITNYSTVVFNSLAGSSTPVRAVTSNLFAKNGTIHVVETQIIYKP